MAKIKRYIDSKYFVKKIKPEKFDLSFIHNEIDK